MKWGTCKLVWVPWLIHVWHDSFTYECVMSHDEVRYVQTRLSAMTHSRVTWLIHTCDMTFLNEWRDVFKRVTWLYISCGTHRSLHVPHSIVWHDSFIYVTRLLHMCETTHLYVWHDSFICVTWLIHMCAMTHSYAWHDSFTRTCDMPHSHTYVWHASFTHVRVTCLIHTRTCDMPHSHTCDTTINVARAKSPANTCGTCKEPCFFLKTGTPYFFFKTGTPYFFLKTGTPCF